MTSLTYRLYIDGTWQDSEGDAVLSGLGLERGEYGLDEFLLSKSIIWSAR